jgi:ABC-type transporter Mla subunit MlaD
MIDAELCVSLKPRSRRRLVPGERAPVVSDSGVSDKNNGHLRLVDPGTGAVLHGMMSMLSEVLDGLDRRLDAMEGRLADLAAAVTVGGVDERLTRAAESWETGRQALESAVGGVAGALEAQTRAHGAALGEATAALETRFDGLHAQVGGIEATVGGLEATVGGLDDRFGALNERVGEVAGAVQAQVGALVERLAELDATLEARTADATGEVQAAVAAAADSLGAAMAARVGDVEVTLRQDLEQRVHAVQADVHAASAHLEAAVAKTTSDIEQQVNTAVARRMAQVEASLAEGRAEQEAAAGRLAVQLHDALEDSRSVLANFVDERVTAAEGAITDRVEGAAGRVAERISESEQLQAGRLDQAGQDIAAQVSTTTAAVAEARAEMTDTITSGIEGLSLTLAELDAAVAAGRAEGAALPANVGETVGALLAGLRTKDRERKRGDDDLPRKVVEDLTARLTRIEQAVGDGLSRVHEAVNRAQGESLDSAQTTTAEVRRLLDAARADVERNASTTVEAIIEEQRKLAGEVVERLRRPTAAHEEQLDATAALAERLVAVQDELDRRTTGLAELVEQSADSATARIAAAERAISTAIAIANAADNDSLSRDVTEELSRLREAVIETHARAGSVATTVAKQVDEVVRQAADALGERIGGRVDQLGQSISAGQRDLARSLPDMLRTTIEEVQEVLAELTASEKERTDQAKAVLDAVAAGNQEHQEVLGALHSSLAKRFDARAKTIVETLDGLSTSLEAAKALGPSLDKVSSRLDAQQPYLDQIRHQLVQLAASMATVPAEVERRHAEATTSLEKVTDTLAALRKHAAALDRAVQAMRTSQDGLGAAFVDLRDTQTIVPQRLDQIGSVVHAGRQQMAEVGELTRTVAAAVEQQQAMSSRLAELVTQVRAATRSDIERVESSIHLEVLKQHQQDQARLTQAVAGVSEVVEREAAVIHQRVAALANEVDAIRLELATASPE